MRIKGRIIELGDVLSEGKPWASQKIPTQKIVIEYPCDPENYKTATIEVVGDRVMRLQELKVGDPITLEFRGKWYLIKKDHSGNYTVVQADSVEK